MQKRAERDWHLRYRHTDLSEPGTIRHCAPHAVAIVLRAPYSTMLAELRPQPGGDFAVEDLHSYIGMHLKYTKLAEPAPLRSLFFRARGRRILFMWVLRGGEWRGHYAALLGRTLYDWSDTRDGFVSGWWR